MDVSSLVLGIASGALAACAAYLAWAPRQRATLEVKREKFTETRAHMKKNAGVFAESASVGQSWRRHDSELPTLAKAGWVPDRPLELDRVELNLESSRDGPLHNFRWRRFAKQRFGNPRATYSSMVSDYDRPSLWFNGPVYLLQSVDVDPANATSEIQLSFRRGNYFEEIDQTEILAYESAERDLASRDLLGGEYRTWLADPFRLDKRSASVGTNTLTIRADAKGRAYFFLHKRDSAAVGTSLNTTHVVPAGEFSPLGRDPNWECDLNLWKNIVREYAEEFLGAEEATGNTGITVNYSVDPPYAAIYNARSKGDVDVRFLGLVLDPLNWKPDICTVAIWRSVSFDRVFHKMNDRNSEGLLLVGERLAKRGYMGLPFTQGVVERYLNDPSTDPITKTCLALTWRWRETLHLT